MTWGKCDVCCFCRRAGLTDLALLFMALPLGVERYCYQRIKEKFYTILDFNILWDSKQADSFLDIRDSNHLCDALRRLYFWVPVFIECISMY